MVDCRADRSAGAPVAKYDDAFACISRSKAGAIKRVHRYNSDRRTAAARARTTHPNAGDGPPRGNAGPAESTGSPAPAVPSVEPATKVVRQPTPRFTADPVPTPEGSVVHPDAGRKRSPTKSGAIRLPTGTETRVRRPCPIHGKIGKTSCVRRRIRVLEGSGRSRSDRLFASGNPFIKIIFRRNALKRGRGFPGVKDEHLAPRDVLGAGIREDLDVTLQNADPRAIGRDVQAEAALVAQGNRKTWRLDGEFVSLPRLGVESSRALIQLEMSDESTIGKAQLDKLEGGVLGEVGGGAMLELNGSPAIARHQDVAFTDGQIGYGGFPSRALPFGAIVAGGARETHVSLREAQADNPHVTVIIGEDRLRKRECQCEQKGKCEDFGLHKPPFRGPLHPLYETRPDTRRLQRIPADAPIVSPGGPQVKRRR